MPRQLLLQFRLLRNRLASDERFVPAVMPRLRRGLWVHWDFIGFLFLNTGMYSTQDVNKKAFQQGCSAQKGSVRLGTLTL